MPGTSSLPDVPNDVESCTDSSSSRGSSGSRGFYGIALLIMVLTASTSVIIGGRWGEKGGLLAVESMNMQIVPQVFSGPDKFQSPKSKDGPISFLDRQTLDCKAEAMHGFQLTHVGAAPATMIGYDYSCIGLKGHNMIKAETLKTFPTSPNKGADGLGSHKVVCPEGTVLTKWNGVTEAGKFFISYTCKTFDVGSYACNEQVTEYSSAGPSNSLVFLDRQQIQCEGNEALRGWWGQLTNDQIRMHYTCCKATAHSPTASPTPVPSLTPSMHPVAEPSFHPSLAPSATPTPAPSAAGTVAPSAQGTEKPTDLPTTPPTVAPTVEPSKGPTREPTREPSMEPSTEPLAAPSPEPTLEPTPKPTAEPTITFRPTTLEPTQSPVPPTMEPTGINYKPADLCGFVFSKDSSEKSDPPKGCALFAKHNLDWLNKEQSSPAFYACASNDEDVKITESDLRSNGLVNKDGSTMLTTIIPGPGVLVTFFSADKFEGLQHTYTEEWHPELSKFHFAGSSGESLKLEREHVKSAIVKSAASSKYISKMPHGWCHN